MNYKNDLPHKADSDQRDPYETRSGKWQRRMRQKWIEEAEIDLQDGLGPMWPGAVTLITLAVLLGLTMHPMIGVLIIGFPAA